MPTWKPAPAALLVVCSLASGCARGTPPAGQPQAVIHVAPDGETAKVRSRMMQQLNFGQRASMGASRGGAARLPEVAPGQRMGEIGAGGGYTTELVARAVGDRGARFAENNRFVLEKFAANRGPIACAARDAQCRARRSASSTIRFRPRRAIDGVYIVLFYHDTVWMGADRDRMNRAVLSALRPGGFYFIIDHAARAGSGTADAQSLHRIDEAFVIAEVERAGFKLNAVGDFLRNPADKHDWNASPRTAGERRGTSARFALQFVKP
jgi:predicted methyltransferase